MKDRLRALVVLLAVFIAGAVIGATGSYMWLRRPVEPPFTWTREANLPPPRMPGRQRLPEMLGMTSDQEKKYHEIMLESRKQLDALRMAQIPKIEEIRSETNRKLAAILSDDQKKKFEALLKELRDRRPSAPRRRGGERSP